jgi:methionine-rich copper-binding protein CopC
MVVRRSCLHAEERQTRAMRPLLPPTRTGTVLVALAALLLALTATAAGAHVEVRESEPAAGGTVTEGLDSISLTLLAFDPDEPVSIEVTDPAGDDVTVGDPQVDARTSTVEVEVQPLEIGAHIVHWQASADDGDGPSEGTYTFQVQEAQGGGWGIWLVWLFALGVPAAIFLRPGTWRGSAR